MDYDELERYERDGEDRFDNFGGFQEDDLHHEDFGEEEFEDDFDPEFYDDYEDYDGYYEYAGNGVGRLDPNDTTYTFIINNTGASEQEVVLFGANEAAQPHADVAIDVAESSHNEVREESKANPFTIVGMKMSVTDTAQYDNVLVLLEKTSGGKVTSYVKQPRNYQSPQNQDKNLIHAMDFTFEVTGKSSIRFKAKPGTTTFTFNVSTRTNIGNVLAGKSVAEVNTTPQATGLPQFDAARVPMKVPAMKPASGSRKKRLMRRSPASRPAPSSRKRFKRSSLRRRR